VNGANTAGRASSGTRRPLPGERAIPRLLLSELGPFPHARAAICNGVGPAFLQQVFPRLFAEFQAWEPNREFSLAACQHDLDYWQGGAPWLKLVADWRFWQGCRTLARLHTGWRRQALLAVAFVYFAGVRSAVGWLAWHWGKRRGPVAVIELDIAAGTTGAGAHFEDAT
jgi:hypothetical protein